MPNQQKQESDNPVDIGRQTKVSSTSGELELGQFGKSIFRSLPIGIVAFGRDLKIIDSNPEAKKLIKLSDKIDKSLAAGTPGQKWTEQLESVVSSGKTRSFDNVTYTLDNNVKLLEIICTPLSGNSTQKIAGGLIIIEDVTERVNIQRQLANAERLATVGKLASKVAHELNNPMDGILRYINLAIRVIEQENLEKPKEYLTQCRTGLMRMVGIVSELLEFSRSTHSPFEHVKVEQLIEEAIQTADTSAEASNVQVVSNYAVGIPRIRTGSLFQVFCNLMKNALAAMPDGGILTVSTRKTADNKVAIEFRDTGTGFDPEHTKLIFEPFFTTKDKGKGTGLGLAICKDIIERYNGRITAENAPGGGSIFTVYLPLEKQNA